MTDDYEAATKALMQPLPHHLWEYPKSHSKKGARALWAAQHSPEARAKISYKMKLAWAERRAKKVTNAPA